MGRAAIAALALTVGLVILWRTPSTIPPRNRAAEGPRSAQALTLEQVGQRLTVPSLTVRAAPVARLMPTQTFIDEEPQLAMALTTVVRASREADAGRTNLCAFELMNRHESLKRTGFKGVIAITLSVSGERGRAVRMEGVPGGPADATFVDCYAGAVSWASQEWDAPQTLDGETTLEWPYTFGPLDESQGT